MSSGPLQQLAAARACIASGGSGPAAKAISTLFSSLPALKNKLQKRPKALNAAIWKAATLIAHLHTNRYQPAGAPPSVRGVPSTSLVGVAVPINREDEWAADIAAGTLAPGPALVGVAVKQVQRKSGGTLHVVFPLDGDDQVFKWPSDKIAGYATPSPRLPTSASPPSLAPPPPTPPVPTWRSLHPLPNTARAASAAGDDHPHRIRVYGLRTPAHDQQAVLQEVQQFVTGRLGVTLAAPLHLVDTLYMRNPRPDRGPTIAVIDVTAQTKADIWLVKQRLTSASTVSIDIWRERSDFRRYINRWRLGKEADRELSGAGLELHPAAATIPAAPAAAPTAAPMTAAAAAATTAMDPVPTPAPPTPHLNPSAPAFMPLVQVPRRLNRGPRQPRRPLPTPQHQRHNNRQPAAPANHTPATNASNMPTTTNNQHHHDHQQHPANMQHQDGGQHQPERQLQRA